MSAIFFLYFSWSSILNESRLELACFLIARTTLSLYLLLTLAETISDSRMNKILAGVFLLVNCVYGWLAWKISNEFGWLVFKKRGAQVRDAEIHAQYLIVVSTVKLMILYGVKIAIAGVFLCVLDDEDGARCVCALCDDAASCAFRPLQADLFRLGPHPPDHDPHWCWLRLRVGGLGLSLISH